MFVLVSPRSAALSERLGAHKVMAAGFGFVAVGFSVMSTVDNSSSYPLIAVAPVLLGIGMGITVAPATGSIMSAVPLNKAGVGSAVNDTTREVGGALGIATLGSLPVDHFHPMLGPDRVAERFGIVDTAAGQAAGERSSKSARTIAASCGHSCSNDVNSRRL